ncbi:hypothetical protein [Zavarzinella formosa]|uniref:hypothetical protein n=1 Tax=Zavarzinella formosa TaxID=360055 RepID=UPI0012FAD801|nr:hypothetical protein [Zavarzinella formosa]
MPDLHVVLPVVELNDVAGGKVDEKVKDENRFVIEQGRGAHEHHQAVAVKCFAFEGERNIELRARPEVCCDDVAMPGQDAAHQNA